MTLEQVKSTKYLGITITDNLDWDQHISEISSVYVGYFEKKSHDDPS